MAVVNSCRVDVSLSWETNVTFALIVLEDRFLCIFTEIDEGGDEVKSL